MVLPNFVSVAATARIFGSRSHATKNQRFTLWFCEIAIGHAEPIRQRQRIADQVVVEHGTLPSDELYFSLVSGSSNLGEVDQQALLDLSQQQVQRNPDGRYQLFRIGDAVASRNIHAAVFDAYRLCLAL